MAEGWTVTIDEQSAGVVMHQGAPRFTATWTTDEAQLAAITGPCWHDDGSGDGEDAIHLFDFLWIDPPPGQAEFSALMEQAAQAIDAWIARRL